MCVALQYKGRQYYMGRAMKWRNVARMSRCVEMSRKRRNNEGSYATILSLTERNERVRVHFLIYLVYIVCIHACKSSANASCCMRLCSFFRALLFSIIARRNFMTKAYMQRARHSRTHFFLLFLPYASKVRLPPRHQLTRCDYYYYNA